MGARCEARPMRTLLVDDHDHFRAEARDLLESQGFDVVGEAADGRGAIAANRSLNPELVLLDVQLPDINGFDVADRLKQDGFPGIIVMISAMEAGAFRRRLPSSSAAGFIHKSQLGRLAIEGVVP